MNREWIEEKLGELPIVQYEWIESNELMFTERIRHICSSECPMYNTTWACPPAVGTVEECRDRCLAYPHALMFTTMAEVGDIANIQECLDTRGDHEAVAHAVSDLLCAQNAETMTLSTEACHLCEKCAWPDAPCRHPEKMFPCIESHGIMATDIAEKYGIDFIGGNVVTWFSLVFYR